MNFVSLFMYSCNYFFGGYSFVFLVALCAIKHRNRDATETKSYFVIIMEIMTVVYIFITRNLIWIMVTIMHISSKSYFCPNLPYCVVGI